MLCVSVCMWFLKLLRASERVFTAQLHDQDVKLLCHDFMRISELQRDVARQYGFILVVLTD